MHLKQISLTNFRSFTNTKFVFNPHLTVIAGYNSVGKTNLLESIYFMMKTHGFREKNEDELISEHELQANVEAVFEEKKHLNQYRIHLSNQNTIIKTCFMDRVKKRAFDYIEYTPPLSIFSPNMVFVIDGEMSERRSFMDDIIFQIDKEYKKRLTNYNNALKKRNKLLESIQDPSILQEQLKFWDAYLIKEAAYINSKRKELADFLNSNPKVQDKTFSITYTPNEITEKTLAETFQKQMYVHRTVVGPQRDSYEIFMNNPTSQPHQSNKKNVHKFGSRSEQRLALFWIVLNEIKLYEQALHRKPIILLDDIFSELDESNKTLILNLIKDYQTIITTTEENIGDLTTEEHSLIKL